YAGLFQDADERTRTSTKLPPHGPEPCASTNSATSADSSRRYRTSGTRRRPRCVALTKDPKAEPIVVGRIVLTVEADDPPSGTSARRSARLESANTPLLVSPARAAIVQGTRTPPSHGGNPGSNPGSGIRRTSRATLRGRSGGASSPVSTR